MKHQLKKWLYGCLTLLSSMATQHLQAQTYCSGSTCEMICNGGFETLTSTPTSTDQISRATGWYKTPSTNNTPELFSSSASPSSSVSVPCNVMGYQQAHTGNNYAGIFHGSTGTNNWLWTEGIGYDFSSTMINGKMYDISFWISKADLSTNNFDNLRVDIGPNYTYNISPSLTNDNVNWILVSFPHCADGSEGSIKIYSAPIAETVCTATITSGCAYTTGVGAYIYIDDVSVKEAKFTVPSQTICANSTATLTATTPTNACAVNTANYSYAWNYGDGSPAVNTGTNITTTHSYSATGTYTGSLIVSAGTCSQTYTYNVVVPNVPISITTNSTTICNGITNFTATPAGASSYTWSVQDAATGTVIPTSNYTITAGNTNTPSINFANINQNVNVCVSITSTLGCNYSQCLYIPSCCATPTNVVKHSNKTFTVNTTVSTASVSFGGTITVNNNITLTLLQTNAQLDPNTKFVVNGTGKIRFVNSYVHGCNYMWDGIYPIATGTVDVLNSIVEDAKRVAIDSLGAATILFTNSYINKNNIGISLKANKTSTSVVTVKNVLFTCSNVSIPAGVNKTPAVTPNLTNASTLGAFTSTVMLPPYNTQKTYCGIYFENASHTGKANSAITIGNNVNEENVFDKIQHGAFVNISKANFQNNVFQNIKSTIAPSSLNSNAGVLVWGPIFGVGGPYYTQVGGATVSLKNTFKNNDLGVASLFPTALLITNNRFETQNTGVYIVWNNNNQTVQTSQNKFINNQVGISYNENTLINSTVSQNWFDNTSAQGTYANNFAIRTTESVPPTNTTNYAKYLIYNNYINGYYNGIYASQTYDTDVFDNEVHMRADNTSGNYQSAIKFDNTNDIDVYNNTSDYPTGTSGWWQFNIFTGGATIPEIHCNKTSYGGSGIVANGLNYTAAGAGIYGNAMSNHGYGFWLNANGEIGDQYYLNGGTNYSADNTWTNCTYETFSNAGCNVNGGTPAKFYTRSANPCKINNATNQGTSGFLLLGTNNSTGFTGDCYGGIATPTLNLKMVGTQKLVMQKADDIANGTIQFNENDASLKQIARKQLFNNLKLGQIDAKFSNDIANFANNAKESPLGTFFLVDSLINTGDTANLNLANTINNGVVTTNDVDLTQQAFNTEYIAYVKNKRKVNTSGILAFEDMANQCPSIYGHAVYQARSVLFNLTKKQYVNICENGKAASQRFASAVINESAINVKLFPNPSNGNITLQTADDLIYNVTVYNLLGEKVFESSVSNNQTLNLAHLSSATYIVHIKQNGNLLKTERISIVD
jgi:hypothetical protein